MLQRRQKLGIAPDQTTQLLGIELGGLSPLAVGELECVSVGDQEPLATLFEQSAHPRGVSAHLHTIARPLASLHEMLNHRSTLSSEP